MTEIDKKLQFVQTRLKAPKSQYNSFGKYHYRNLEDIVEGVKPLLAEVGAVLTLSDDVVLIGDRYYVRATATFHCGDSSVSVSALAREPQDRKGMDESQITGCASSYARKYAVNGLFAIDDTKDADSDDNSEPKKASKSHQDKPQSTTRPKAEEPIDTAAIVANDSVANPENIKIVNDIFVHLQKTAPKGMKPDPDKLVTVIVRQFGKLPKNDIGKQKCMEYLQTIHPLDLFVEAA